MRRRDFLRTAACGAVALSAAPCALADPSSETAAMARGEQRLRDIIDQRRRARTQPDGGETGEEEAPDDE